MNFYKGKGLNGSPGLAKPGVQVLTSGRSERPVRIGVQIHPQHGTYQEMRRAAREAENMGADLLYTWDHFFPLYGSPDGAHFECWSLLAAWAEATERIELGPLVSCNSYRNPNMLADMARTVDHISEGRLVFGIGSGWFRRDYGEYGYEFGTAASRGRDLERNLPIILERWSKLNPPPVRLPPIMIGGVGEQITLRLVAQYADLWHAMFPSRPEELEPKVAALERWSREVGRDPRDIEWSVGIEPDALEHVAEHSADAYLEMGFTQFTLGVNGPDYELGPVKDWLAWRDECNAVR